MRSLGLQVHGKGGDGPKHKWQDDTRTGARTFFPNMEEEVGEGHIDGDEFLGMVLDFR